MAEGKEKEGEEVRPKEQELDAIKKERAACAQLLDTEAKRLRELASKCYQEGGLDGPSMYSRVKWAAEICEKMAEQIRARSAEKGEGKNELDN